MRRAALIGVPFVLLAVFADRFTGLRGHMPWLVPVERLMLMVLCSTRRGGDRTGSKPAPI